jgi:hypothetical protein
VDQNQLTGAVRFHGYGEGGDYHEEAKGEDMGGHIYIEGMVTHYALTGDRRSLRSFERAGQALIRGGYGSGDTREQVLSIDERSLTRPGIALLAIYDLTRDPQCLNPVQQMVNGFNSCAGDMLNDMTGQDPFRTWWLYRGDFVNHVQELLVRYHIATGDSTTLKTLQETCDLTLRDNWDPELEALRGPDNQPFDRPWPKFPRKAIWWSVENAMQFAYLFRKPPLHPPSALVNPIYLITPSGLARSPG